MTAVRVGASSDYCQRWLNGRHSWRHPSAQDFAAERFKVQPMPERASPRAGASRSGTPGNFRYAWPLGPPASPPHLQDRPAAQRLPQIRVSFTAAC